MQIGNNLYLGVGDEHHWDVVGFLAGSNYTEKVEVTFKFVMEERPDLHVMALALLRPAVAARPEFAIISHILGNTLVRTPVSRRNTSILPFVLH